MSFILFTLIVIAVNGVLDTDHYYHLPKSETGIIIDKSNTFVYGKEIYLLENDSIVKSYDCYSILYNEIQIGDSVVNGKIKDNHVHEFNR